MFGISEFFYVCLYAKFQFLSDSDLTSPVGFYEFTFADFDVTLFAI